MGIGRKRCDAVVTTGDGTGKDCPTEKLAEFKKLLGDFPLVVGAGVTADTVAEKLKFADAVIIGSWLKKGHSAENDVRFIILWYFGEYICATIKFVPPVER